MAETIILISAWIVMLIFLIILVPKNKLREAQLVYLFKQFLTWLFGLIVAQYGLIDYPFRLFSYATRADFTFEFFFYPAVCVIFNLYFPENKGKLRQAVHYISYSTAITLFEILIEKYTQIINYIHWTWYLTWITLFVTFWFSRAYYVWFFKRKGRNSGNKSGSHV